MSFLDFIDAYSSGLPDDFFSEDLRDMVAAEKMVMIVEDGVKVGESVIDVSPLLVVTADGSMSVGRRHYVAPFYEVHNDLEPSEEVLSYWKKRQEVPDIKFPHINQMDPIIPPSKYDKQLGENLVEEYLISHDFYYFQPGSHGIGARHPERVDFEVVPNRRYVLSRLSDIKLMKNNDWVMFEDNIYHPKVVSRIDTIEKISGGYKCEVKWKQGSYITNFKFKHKRVHSDVWISSFFSEPSKAHYALAHRDLICSTYTIFFSIIDRVVYNPVDYEPFFVDPYIRSGRKKIPYGFSSLEDCVMLDGIALGHDVFLPWRTQSVVFDRESGNMKFYRYDTPKFKLDGYNIDVFSMYKTLKQKQQSGSKDCNRYATVLSKIFVQKKPMSLHDDTIVKDKFAMTRREFAHCYVRDDRRGDYSMTLIDVCFKKSPKNHLGQSLVDMSFFKAVEFVAQKEELLRKMGRPYWEMRENMVKSSTAYNIENLEWSSVVD